MKADYKGFRPLAGIMVLIQAGHGIIMKSDVMFPSPCGDYGSYLGRNAEIIKAHCHSFRPLAGIMVLIAWPWRRKRCPGRRFRPLAGIMVLIRTLYKWLHEAVEMAFCGADHIFSSFFVFCKKMIFKKLLRTEF